MSRPRILIVDDEPDVLLLLRVNLEGEGFSTVLAADGETALLRIEEDNPDIVLLDVMMPVLDGWGVLRVLAERPGSPPVVIVSAKTTDQDLARAYQLGVADYVTKPFSVDELVTTVRRVLGRNPDDHERHRREVLERIDAGPDGAWHCAR